MALLAFILAAPSNAATFVVTTTADAGPGSLRQAILDANTSPGSAINFSVGTGVITIRPLTELPELVVGNIDGTTQPGFAGSPIVQINGDLLTGFSNGVTMRGGTVRSLVVNRCPGAGIRAGSAVVVGNYVGTDVTGQIALPNGIGVRALNTLDVPPRIGGTTLSERNVISGNAGNGILAGFGAATILGNYIGTNAAGTAALPNGNNGIELDGAHATIVGGAGAGAGNLISGNGQYGVSVYGSTDVVVQGNVIGPAIGGAALPSSHQRAGVMITGSSRTRVGGTQPGEANVIAYHDFTGIGVEPNSVRNVLSANSLFSNAFGIDLDFVLNDPDSRVTPNDPGDADSGPNLLQNFPVLQSVHSLGGVTTIAGTIDTTATSRIHLEFFSNAACNNSGYGEGRTYLGSADVMTNSSGIAIFEAALSVSVPPAEVVTATATDELGNTSEFSACQAVIAAAPSGRSFNTLSPCRVIDTRLPNGGLSGPALSPSSSRTFPLAGTCGIPATARDISVNVTVTGPAAPGHLTLHAADVVAPPASTINFRAGQTRANNAIVRLSNDGSGSIAVQNAASGTVHFILDVNGYFE